MRISFSPQLRDDTLTLEKTGDRLRINGDLFNFNGLVDGDRILLANLPGEWFAEDVTKTGDEVHVTLLLPHSPNPSHEVAFPEDVVTTADGPIAVPRNEPGPANEMPKESDNVEP